MKRLSPCARKAKAGSKLTGDVTHASGVVLERDLVYAEARFTVTAEPQGGIRARGVPP